MSNSKLISDFESLVKEEYSHLSVQQVIELQDFIRFVLVDEGDFEGLTDFVQVVRQTFNGRVELRRESTKSFQLEVLLPKSAIKKNSTHQPEPLPPWLPLAMLTCILTMLAASLVWLSKGF